MKIYLILCFVIVLSHQEFIQSISDSEDRIQINLPVVINTWVPNGYIGAAKQAWLKLSRGSSALDSVEFGCNWCETLQEFSNYTTGCDGTVGLGGSPDQNGETTLDAMIMDGDTMNVGAVAALRRIQHAISVARKVMDTTYHTLIVGDQATQFAIESGFKEMSLSTSHSANMWANWMLTKSPNYRKDSNLHANSQHQVSGHDTIGMVAIDKYGSIACGTSSNGASFKIPGRVGDSPIMGAGAYCETGVGGATGTGDGDQMMRFLPSFAAVQYMRQGFSATEACEKAIEPIKKYFPNASGALICLKADGTFGGAKLNYESFSFSARNSQMSDAESITI